MVTYKRLAEKAGLDERITTFLVDTMGCRTLEDLENVSEIQVDERIIPAIADLDAPLVMGSRLKKLIKAIQEAAKISWDYNREEAMEDENVPLASEELKRLEILFFNRYKMRVPADEDANESVVSRLKRQLNKHCISFEDILKTKTKRGESAGTRIERTWQNLFMKLGNRTDLGDAKSQSGNPIPSQPRTI